GDEALTSKSEIQNPKSKIDPSLLTSAATNGVLNLLGEGSYAVLPSNILAGLTEATIEGWTKWTGGQPPPKNYEIVFMFGELGRLVWLGTPPHDRSTLEAGFVLVDGEHTMTVPNVIRTDEWLHWAFVTGPGGMKLFLNGVLAASKIENASLVAL